ncbi:hypothetical protein BDZ90DRAFT_262867 [Jaminaea rosea]|uniref:Uncharacterized protein n=1 Tax=Jaminaea rosea TaxID=1569628 RepID=A0A316UIG7_9BASI|nr:hypothetical protein BDZ90DRAFT_262867 [Jaminaea rosea]PWN25019.1 hypothetical protein BDZ90DRAFT_262867 [Jaminaea rosea]
MNPFARDAQSRSDPHNIQHLLSLLRENDEQPTPPSIPRVEEQRSSDPRLKGRAQPQPKPPASASANAPPLPHQPPPPRPDLRHLTPSQALPELRRLAKDGTFLRLVMKTKREQDALERRLADSRRERERGDEEEEERWARASLEEWDQMVKAQQLRFHKAGLPGFFETSSPAARDNQRKILELLGELIEADD